ncbi:hypothetical protein [Streptomyces sp. NPDC058751]|uniref:hypothetical protein n=1 Tax=Streptomyces sp. NPDC058751 TaxID=3346623 RepID=UPI003689DF34
MAHPAGPDGLGPLISECGYDRERARRNAVGWLVVGVLGTGIGVPVTIAYIAAAGNSGFSPLPGVLLGIGLVGLWVGGTLLTRSVTRRAEVFRLHGGGLVHRRAGTERALPWPDIARVVYRENDRPTARLVGTDVHCVIHLKAGGRLRITGYHDNAHRVGSAAWRAVAKKEFPAGP